MKKLNKDIYYYLFILLFVFIPEIYSQGKIIGTVKDSKYLTPIKDVSISLYKGEANQKLYGTLTDGTGFFAFNDIEYGVYNLEISAKGYSGYKIKNIAIYKKSNEVYFDTLSLTPGKTNVTEIVLKYDKSETVINEERSIKDGVNESSEYKITGTVRDKKDHTPVKDAAVLIFRNNDTVKYSGTGTDETGFFAFNNLVSGKYKLEISYIGYSVYKVRDIVLEEKSPSCNLDTIMLFSNSFKTDEIVVQDEKPEIEFNDDKKVFNVDKIMTSRGGTAIDVLKKLPMLEVDANDNVSLRGSKNAIILIDNKPMKFSSLRQLPADAIKNVEIITNPSAKYEAEGVTGIINIVMRSNKTNMFGYNGYLYSGYRDNRSYNTGIGIDLKKNKFSFFLNGGLGDYNYKGETSSDVTYFQPQSYFGSNATFNGNSKYYYGGMGMEYELKKNHSIGLDGYANFNRFENSTITNSNNYNASHLLTSLYRNNYASDGKWDNFSTSLYYTGKFGKVEKELNFDATYSEAKNENNTNQNIQYYDSLSRPVNNTPTKQLNVTNGKNKNLRIQLDYSNPFNDKTKFETGYKGIFRINDNDYRSDTLNYTINNFVVNNDVTNHFKLSEYINAVYGTFSHKIKNFRFKLGLRAEHTHSKGELITNNTSFKKDYIDLFPTVSLSQKIGMSHELQVSYSRRITRPMIYRLNPFVNKSNSKFIYMGNPELTPEYSDSYELSYMFISNIVNVTPMAFYRKSKDVISNYSYLIDSNITVSTYKNFASGYSYGMDFIISSRALKWWNLSSTFSFYKSKYEATVTNDYSGEEGFSWKANIRSFFTFGELFNLELYYDYTGKKVNASGYNEPSQNLDASLSKSFFNKKLTVGIRVEDIFKTRKWGSETNGIGVRSYYQNSWDTRGAYLNISYNFGNSDKYYKKSKKTKQNENEKSDVNDEGNK